MVRLLTAVFVVLSAFYGALCAQEIDPDTLHMPEEFSWMDDLLLEATPGTSVVMRSTGASDVTSVRALMDHPSYRVGVVRTPSSGTDPLWWVIARGKGWTVGLGQVAAESGLGSIVSSARGFGRSRLAPARTSSQPMRGGVGGVRGAALSVRLDTSTTLHLLGGSITPSAQGLLAGWLEGSLFSGVATATLFARESEGAPSGAAGLTYRRQLEPFDFGAEIALDGRCRGAMQAVIGTRRATASASLSLWYADADCNLPLGSIMATAERATNSWGLMLRLRSTIRGMANFRCSAALFGRPWRTRLLPMASAGYEIIADLEQRVTHRLRADWRLWHKHDEDGVSLEQRRQQQRRMWSARLRIHRRISPMLDVRANADVRLVRLADGEWLSGSFGWIDLRWNPGPLTTLRARASVFASELTDAAITTVEFTSVGLQSMVRGLGFGRRVSVGLEWKLGAHVTTAAQAFVQQTLRQEGSQTDIGLRLVLRAALTREDIAKAVASPADDKHEPHE
jgi:hypothetical protein